MAERTDFYLGIATLLFAAIAAAIAIAEPFRVRDNPPRSFHIEAAEEKGRVHVDWNPADVPAFRADSAVLRVKDGGNVHEYRVDKKTLDHGGFDYLRTSNDVLLSLVLLRNGQPRAEAMVRTVVAESKPAPLGTAPPPRSVRESTRTRRR